MQQRGMLVSLVRGLISQPAQRMDSTFSREIAGLLFRGDRQVGQTRLAATDPSTGRNVLIEAGRVTYPESVRNVCACVNLTFVAALARFGRFHKAEPAASRSRAEDHQRWMGRLSRTTQTSVGTAYPARRLGPWCWAACGDSPPTGRRPRIAEFGN